MRKKNLIMGIIQNYDFEDLKAFIVSIRKTSFEGDIILFIKDIDKLTQKKLMRYLMI